MVQTELIVSMCPGVWALVVFLFFFCFLAASIKNAERAVTSTVDIECALTKFSEISRSVSILYRWL